MATDPCTIFMGRGSDMVSPAVSLHNVSLRYASTVVFDRLNLHFEAGQLHCVLGRSGVGKTSLLQLLNGQCTPDSGAVSVSNAQDLSPQVAYMAQDDSLLPWLTVQDNVLLGRRLRGESLASYRDHATHLLNEVGLSDSAKQFPHELSGGMRQRAALARTLLEERPIILMDEPFSRLDSITRHELQALACNVLKDRTVILVTHDPSEACRMGHSIRVLQTGLPSKTAAFHPRHAPHRPIGESDELTRDLWAALVAETAPCE